MGPRRTLAVLAASLAVYAGPTSAQSFSKNTELTVDDSIRRLLRQMDIDKSGTVTKDEFLRYFSERFDRLDLDHNRRLHYDELRSLVIRIPNAKAGKHRRMTF